MLVVVVLEDELARLLESRAGKPLLGNEKQGFGKVSARILQGRSKEGARIRQGCSKYVPSKSLGCCKEPAEDLQGTCKTEAKEREDNREREYVRLRNARRGYVCFGCAQLGPPHEAGPDRRTLKKGRTGGCLGVADGAKTSCLDPQSIRRASLRRPRPRPGATA